ncbi:MAG: hypothetical protein P4L87_00255 [Formivibrio sp.]|nr:hypothetical protein [Formivibrio sp.]
MDYYQGIVAEYLRTNRKIFVNPEFCLQLELGANNPSKGNFWYVDIVATDFAQKIVYLCEVTYSNPPSALIKKLSVWSENWADIVCALRHYSAIPEEWSVRPWIFMPTENIKSFLKKIIGMQPVPKITPLEMTQPWTYPWNREEELTKPDIIPIEMR